ncbi:hypothetical protein D3C71_1538490 [compost metagenome]
MRLRLRTLSRSTSAARMGGAPSADSASLAACLAALAARRACSASGRRRWRASRTACMRHHSWSMVSLASPTSVPVACTAKSNRGASSVP